MTIEQKLVRCEPNDPNRCQGPGDGGEAQCVFLSVEGATRCWKHGAHVQLKSVETQKCHDYRLQQWQARVDEFSSSEKVTTLKGEIAILRMMLEETLRMCQNVNDLMLYSHRIQGLVSQIDKCVNSVAKIELRTGNLLDKGQALVLAGQIVNVIGKHIKDASAIDKISNELINLIAALAGKDIELDD